MQLVTLLHGVKPPNESHKTVEESYSYAVMVTLAWSTSSSRVVHCISYSPEEEVWGEEGEGRGRGEGEGGEGGEEGRGGGGRGEEEGQGGWRGEAEGR